MKHNSCDYANPDIVDISTDSNPGDAYIIRDVLQHVHYRLVLNEVGYPLSNFSRAHELFGAVGDALDGDTSQIV